MAEGGKGAGQAATARRAGRRTGKEEELPSVDSRRGAWSAEEAASTVEAIPVPVRLDLPLPRTTPFRFDPGGGLPRPLNPASFATLYTLTLFVVDLLGGALGLVLAYVLRFHVLAAPKGWNPDNYLHIFPWAAALWMAARFLAGLNRFRQRAFDLRVLRRVAKASALAMLLITAAAFMTQVQYSRLLPPLIFASLLLAVAGLRWLADVAFSALRVRLGWGISHVALVGVSQTGRMAALKIANHPEWGCRVVGFLTTRPGEAEGRDEWREGLPILGDIADIGALADRHNLHEVIVTQPDLSPQRTVEFLLECEKMCLKASVVPNILEMVVTDVHLDDIGGLPLLGLSGSRLRGGNLALKRVFDIVVSTTMLAALSPLMLAIALAVRLTSRGPILYRQDRVTLYGTSFAMYKFRSMRVDAEQATGPVWAREGDDRTTPLGSLLRKWNLDELPQLLNVLKGDMSLVGPRPERPFFVEQFKDQIPHYMARLHVKAGITGWAQVNGLRGNTSLSERIKYDLFYVENWSIWFDVKILIMTLTARENAY